MSKAQPITDHGASLIMLRTVSAELDTISDLLGLMGGCVRQDCIEPRHLTFFAAAISDCLVHLDKAVEELS